MRWVGKCVLFRELSSVHGPACNTVQYMSESLVGKWGGWLWVLSLLSFYLSYLASML